MHKHRTSLQTTTDCGRLEYGLDRRACRGNRPATSATGLPRRLRREADALKLFSDFAVNGFSRFISARPNISAAASKAR
jgi:hypothetical protein